MRDKFTVRTTETTATTNAVSPLEPFNSATFATADICVMCAICDEYTPMNSADCRAQRIFICDKCKAAVGYIRALLENGGSLT